MGGAGDILNTIGHVMINKPCNLLLNDTKMENIHKWTVHHTGTHLNCFVCTRASVGFVPSFLWQKERPDQNGLFKQKDFHC